MDTTTRCTHRAPRQRGPRPRMTDYTFTVAANADPDAVAKYQLRRAKLKPQCCACGKNLPAKIAAASNRASLRVCSDRHACQVRSIFRTPARTKPWR